MVSGLRNVAPELAAAVGAGLGMDELPSPLPKVATREVTPEVTISPALSLSARPGDGGIQARRIAILVADGCDGAPLIEVSDRLTAEGAAPRFLGSRLGTVRCASGEAIEVDATVEATPSVLYDAVVLPGGDAPAALRADGRVVEFVRDQYRHCKTILAFDDGGALFAACGIAGGPADPGLIVDAGDTRAACDAFVTALGRHRHFERESDPPPV
jgi:catalase